MASMKLVITMAVACVVAAWTAVAVAASQGTSGIAGPVFGGMIGPLLAAAGTWILVVRTHRANPAAVTSVMMTAFMVKAIFFAAYCVVMIKGFRFDVSTFAISFAAFFIALYGVEAALFARLFRDPAHGVR
jgi:hypothetical protein